jgi:formylglycine-generating enzyme required for sulfatase activity
VYSHSNVFLSPSNLSIYIESSTSLRLIWIDDVDGEEYFSIDRKIGQDGTWNELYSTSESNTNTWVDSGLSTGTIYFYRLRAYASNFYTNYTQEVNLAPQITPNNMVIVPIGSFMMGQENVATPVHSVTITRPFYLGRRELSQLEWSLYMPADIYGLGQGDNYPVYNVSWYEILVYCNLRSIDEGLNPCYTIKGSTDPSYWFDIPTETNSDWNSVICNFEANGYRLPTEAEWEYTARYNDGRAYPWGYGIAPSTELCNYNNMVGSTTEVTSYSRGASELYLLNLSGNISEWLWDVYATYSSTAQTDPTGPLTGGARVRRGGSWNTFWVRLTDRVYSHPYGQGSEVGFRLARTRK